MKPENIEERKAKRKREAVYGVLGFAGMQVAFAVFIGGICLIPDAPRGVVILCAALAVVCLLLIVPALCALKERFKEIEGGELDASGKY